MGDVYKSQPIKGISYDLIARDEDKCFDLISVIEKNAVNQRKWRLQMKWIMFFWLCLVVLYFIGMFH